MTDVCVEGHTSWWKRAALDLVGVSLSKSPTQASKVMKMNFSQVLEGECDR